MNRKNVAACAVVALLGAFMAQAETYWWTGAVDTGVNTAGNWALESGVAATQVPGKGDTVVFTNSTDLTVTRTAATSWLNYRFEGSGAVTIDGKFSFNLQDGGMAYVASGASGTLPHTETLNGGDEFTVLTETSNSSLYFTYGTATINGSVRKKGSGTWCVRGSNLKGGSGAIALEEGTVMISPNNSTVGKTYEIGTVSCVGDASKTIVLHGQYLEKFTIKTAYSEDAAAEGKVTFYSNSSVKGNTNIFTCAQDTRISADAYSSTAGKPMVMVWNPSDGSSTMTVVKRTYTRASGRFVVASGTLRFAEGAGATLFGGVEVASGASLAFAADSGAALNCPVTVSEGGSISIEGGYARSITIGSLITNGVAVADGRYRAADLECLSGEGILVVGEGTPSEEPATTTATWTGNGDNDNLTTPGNWEDGILPDLDSGSLVATFPEGSTAFVPAGTTVAFKGIVVSASSFTISGGSASVMKLGSEGVRAEGTSFVLACPTVIACSQTWYAESTCTFDIAQAGVLTALWPVFDTLSMTGDGTYRIYSSNPNLCNVAYYADIEAWADNPLGGPYVTAESMVNTKTVKCHGSTFSNNFLTRVNAWSYNDWHFFTICSGTNVFNGDVFSNQGNGHYWRFAKTDEGKAAVVKFKGGYRQAGSNNNVQFSPFYTGTMIVEDVPMNLTRMYVGFPGSVDDNNNFLYLNVASNMTTRGIHVMNHSVLNTTVADAICATDGGQSGVLLNEGATWNLSADQGVNVFGGVGSTAVVNSGNGATLHLRDDLLNSVKTTETQTITHGGETAHTSLLGSKVQTNKVVFAGNVNFSKEGTLDHFMEGVSTSTGSVTVKKGRLIFTTGSWRNAGGVSVEGDGQIEIRNAAAFDKETPFAFSGESTDGMMVIPSGTTVKLSSVTVNGKLLNGMFCSGLVTGGGTLAAGTVGLGIIIR